MLFDLTIDQESRLQAVKPNQFLGLDIGILPISPGIYAILKANNIHRLLHFLDYSAQELHNIPGMTNEALFEVLGSLRRYGIRFFPPSDSEAFKAFQVLLDRDARREKAKRDAENALKMKALVAETQDSENLKGQKGRKGQKGEKGLKDLKAEKGLKDLKAEKGEKGLKAEKGKKGLKADKGQTQESKPMKPETSKTPKAKPSLAKPPKTPKTPSRKLPKVPKSKSTD